MDSGQNDWTRENGISMRADRNIDMRERFRRVYYDSADVCGCLFETILFDKYYNNLLQNIEIQ